MAVAEISGRELEQLLQGAFRAGYAQAIAEVERTLAGREKRRTWVRRAAGAAVAVFRSTP